jgi:TolB-like protein
MKKIATVISLLLLLLCPVSSAFAQSDGGKPKIVVYMTGGNIAAEDKALRSRMLAAISKSGLFHPIERTDAFLEQIVREHKKQQDGSVDDSQILKAGRQYGAQYACIGDITEAFGIIQINARIVDIETAEILAASVAESETAANLTGAMDKVVSDMTPAVVKALSRK